jgi:hypothetical protein
MEDPVPMDVPSPHPPSYHFQSALVPNEPLLTVSVTLPPRQSCPFVALLEAPAGSTETVLTVTLNVQLDVPQAFVAVQVTGVVPAGNVLPLIGEQVTSAAGNPEEEGSVHVATKLPH